MFRTFIEVPSNVCFCWIKQCPKKKFNIQPMWCATRSFISNVTSPRKSGSAGIDNNFDLCDDFHDNRFDDDKLILKPTKNILLKTIEQKLKCTLKDAMNIVKKNPELKMGAVNEISKTIKCLLDNEITPKSILDIWLLKYNESKTFFINHNILNSSQSFILENFSIKIPYIRLMKPRDINDFVPLLILPPPRLNQIRLLTKYEESIVPGGHRVYFLSNELKVQDSLPFRCIHNLS